MTDEKQGTTPAEADPVPRCPFCGAADCPWLVAVVERREFGWHPHTLTNRVLPQFGPGLGEMVVQSDPRHGIRPRLIVSLEQSGEEMALRLRRAASIQAAGAGSSGLVMATSLPDAAPFPCPTAER